MNANFGLFPPLDAARSGRRGRCDRYKAYTDRAKQDFATWMLNSQQNRHDTGGGHMTNQGLRAWIGD